jgi:protein O-mannosyl-transferase
VGVFIAIVWGVFDLLQERAASRETRRAVSMATGVLIAVLIACARVQAGYWHDSVSLFEHALRVTRGNYVAHLNLGVALKRSGDREGAKRQYEAALRLQPDYPRALYNYGVVLQDDGDLDGASSYYRRALRVWPTFVDAHYNLGLVYDTQKKLAAAIHEYQAALRVAPDHVQARNNLAIAYYYTGRYAEAWQQVHAAQALGFEPHPGFLRALSEKMPEP